MSTISRALARLDELEAEERRARIRWCIGGVWSRTRVVMPLAAQALVLKAASHATEQEKSIQFHIAPAVDRRRPNQQ